MYWENAASLCKYVNLFVEYMRFCARSDVVCNAAVGYGYLVSWLYG